jgi:hypothetical protein
MAPPPLADTSITSLVFPTATAVAMDLVAVSWEDASSVNRLLKLGTLTTVMDEYAGSDK